MDVVNVTEAKARLSELLERAGAGETITIARRGVPIAMLSPIAKPRVPIDIARLKRLTDGMAVQDYEAGCFVRQMRDDARY